MTETFQSVKVNIGSKEELEIQGYKYNSRRTLITVLLSILSAGLLLIPISWRPAIKMWCTFNLCSLDEATRVLVKDIYGQVFEEKVVEASQEEEDVKRTVKTRYFINKKIKYVWDDRSYLFHRIQFLPGGTTMANLHDRGSGLDESEVTKQRYKFGENFIKIKVASVWKLLVDQLALVVVWVIVCLLISVLKWQMGLYFTHLYYLSFILLVYVLLYAIIGIQHLLQSRALKKRMTSHSKMKVFRNNQTFNVSTVDLVPGDIVMVGGNEETIEVDAVLLSGAVVTNEAMLTGESVPVTKVELPYDTVLFDKELHKQHIIFCGTQLLQVRGGEDLPALVISTGFDTYKGELVRSILFPKPMDFHIYTDFIKLMSFFFTLGLGAMCWSFYAWASRGATVMEIVFNSMDLITFVIPPILPATITAINVWAQRRLKQHNIYCLSSNYISLAGPVDVVCFDKTGTLTDSNLNIGGALPCTAAEFTETCDELRQLPLASPFVKALATCHSLVPSGGGQFIGHPLDLKIFNGLQWSLKESGEAINSDYGQATPMLVKPLNAGNIPVQELEIAILKTYPFQSKELRMTVVTRSYNSTDYNVYIKGAPEVIASLCNPNTVPDDFEQVLMWYTSQGLRVVAAAVKTICDSSWEVVDSKHRNDLESDSTFLGLVLLQNSLKPQTSGALSTLHAANINSVMITGDNLLTATSVAKKCGLVAAGFQIIIVEAQVQEATVKAVQHVKVHYFDEQDTMYLVSKHKGDPIVSKNYVFAIEGKSFDLIYQNDRELFRKIVHRGKVFARMKPDQKILVIEELQELGHQVAMCGDGCNDCGALKAAHAGISLSSTESSVAAPFTSQDPNIDCVAKLILEGRATLVSIYASFKYNISYCFSALLIVLILYTIVTEPSDTQYLIMDLVLITVPSLVLGNTGAPSQLVSQRPSRRILSPTHIISIISFLGIQAFFYIFTWKFIHAQSWFTPFEYVTGSFPPPPSYEETYLVIVAFYSFVMGAFVFSHGHPFRLPFYTNKILTAYICLATILCIFMNFCTAPWFTTFLNFRPSPSPAFSGVLFLGVIFNFIICVVWEKWVLYGLFDKKFLRWIKTRFGPHAPYVLLEKEFLKNKWFKLTTPSNITPEPDESNLPPTYDAATADYYHDATPTMMRKLTRKHKFKGTVKYKNEVTVNEEVSEVEEEDSHYPKPFKDLKFNRSVKGQMLQGTTEGLSSFTGNKTKKRQEQNDENIAAATELNPLQNNEQNFPAPYDVMPLQTMDSVRDCSNMDAPQEILVKPPYDESTPLDSAFTPPRKQHIYSTIQSPDGASESPFFPEVNSTINDLQQKYSIDDSNLIQESMDDNIEV